ncbi:hypothetical protein COCHEDRAFT_1116322, partial [Bipolaris maydis C5]
STIVPYHRTFVEQRIAQPTRTKGQSQGNEYLTATFIRAIVTRTVTQTTTTPSTAQDISLRVGRSRRKDDLPSQKTRMPPGTESRW